MLVKLDLFPICSFFPDFYGAKTRNLCFRTSTSHDSLGHFVLLNQTGIVSGHFGEEKSLLNHTIKFG